MIFTDTHNHLYLKEFDSDREQVIQDALEKDVRYMLLPNIDSRSVKSMLDLCDKYPGILFPMMGLHPTSVKENFQGELDLVTKKITHNDFIAIGEIGIDLYWDTTYEMQQENVFRRQLELSVVHDLPVVIHSRNSIDRIISILTEISDSRLKGVFHCFSGTLIQARKIIATGFYLGIGGVITFKNSGLDKVAAQIDLEHILLETDAPYLAPVPYRGKRNEPSYLPLIAKRLAQIKNISAEDVADITTNNAIKLFKFIK